MARLNYRRGKDDDFSRSLIEWLESFSSGKEEADFIEDSSPSILFGEEIEGLRVEVLF